MNEVKVKKIGRDKLPWFYRLVLKIPGADFLVSSSSGVFWAIVVPVFLVLEFFLSIFLILIFPFPVNVLLTAIISIVVFMIFIKVSLERFMNWWDSIVGESGLEWDVEKRTREYVALLEKRKEKKE